MKKRNSKGKIVKLIHELKNFISDFLFPRRCFVCDQILEPWDLVRGAHGKCLQRVTFNRGDTCMHCGVMVGKNTEFCAECRATLHMKKGTFTQGKALFAYKGPMKETMYRFKYSGKQEYALAFAGLFEEEFHDWVRDKKIDVICPVPMYGRKKRRRGYNQADALAEAFAARLQLPCEEKMILRVQDTKPMKTLSREERFENLKNAFKIREDMVQYYQNPLIVDDIYTTGATADAISTLLLQTGIGHVYYFSVCIGRGV